jgi:glutamate-1-semialdehyde aminotransferase
MEPTRNVAPKAGFLAGVRELSDQVGALLVVDEITAGWRFTLGGAHLLYGLEPDLAVFAKSLGNGHPMAAVIGRASAMAGAADSFISSTYWTESVGPVAALATIGKFQRIDVPRHVDRIGMIFRDGLQQLGTRHGVPLSVVGHPPLATIAIDHPQHVAISTLFTVRMLDHGILSGNAFYPTWVHQDAHVERYLAAADIVLAELAAAIRLGDVESRMGGPVKHTGFKRLN